MSHTKTDAELEKLYKDGHGASHAHAIRQVYQAGRADEAAALKAAKQPGPTEGTDLAKAQTLKPKRPVKNPGDAPSEGTSQPGAATPAAEAGGADDSAADPTDPPTLGAETAVEPAAAKAST